MQEQGEAARGQAGEKNRETAKETRREEGGGWRRARGRKVTAGGVGFVGNFAYLRHRGWPRLILPAVCEKKEPCRGCD